MADILKERLGEENYQKLMAIDNPEIHRFIAHYIEVCEPDRVFVCNDSAEDVQYIRDQAIERGEESPLAINGHTVHFDGYYDQARDKENTKFLLPEGVDLGPNINSIPKKEGLEELASIMKGIMKGHEMFVCFFTLGPANSEFSIPCIQLTDSPYVAHSETILYRPGYEEFKRLGRKARYFRFVHSEGELINNVSKNIDKRRIYIDTEDDIVYSFNTQYGGNTIGLKKLAMRLAINRGAREGWLTEHMLIMGVHGPDGRVTYFTGAFPSLCGKTSTAMLEGEMIIGDDIAYLRKKDGVVRGVNVEKGMFGIIMGINSKDDPIIWETLHRPAEIIFSNVLIKDGKPYWIGMDDEIPTEGINHSGKWFKGKKDKEGNEITPSHRNARFTVALKELKNCDPRIDDPEGVVIGGIIYGGRDSDTWVPVEQSFDWVHGIITKGASLESETTAATLGKAGVRKFNLMSNLDFLSIPIGRYIQINLDFGRDLKKPPLIFGVNYFLKGKDGNYLNAKTDKKVWLKWMELRVHGEVDAIKTPTGYIPKYEDLKRLFQEVLNKDYSLDDYNEQFKLRVNEHLAKIDRISEIYKTKVFDTPEILFKVLEDQRQRLIAAREKFGDYIIPEKFK
ncbi:phosphoenolpyruvate carboxykinase (GTP) [candidate division WOR-3 bacterium]|uniref:Phosphoenolpyruvate carboxykinase [GTP] n=1 Tax=candidate division WOR-3 bacterium TaxID=2052148 RepID=A0A660SE67_UNCW3|nr:MAG: phosphoenolpyruvate carboxykinase (GTP) [candidate division WOR-3 bacterium]